MVDTDRIEPVRTLPELVYCPKAPIVRADVMRTFLVARGVFQANPDTDFQTFVDLGFYPSDLWCTSTGDVLCADQGVSRGEAAIWSKLFGFANQNPVNRPIYGDVLSGDPYSIPIVVLFDNKIIFKGLGPDPYCPSCFETRARWAVMSWRLEHPR